MSRPLENVLKEEFPPAGEIRKEAGAGDAVGLMYRREIVEVPVAVVRERFVELEPKIVEKEVEVPEIRIVEKIKEVRKVIEQEKVTFVPKIIQREKIVEVPQFREVEVVKERVIGIPQIEERFVEKKVEVLKYVEVPFQTIVDVPVKTEVNRHGLSLYEVTVIKEYTIPTPKVVYEDIDVEIRLPKFVQVLPKQPEEIRDLISTPDQRRQSSGAVR